MRIAMFTNNYKPYIGGVPVSIEHLAAALREMGHTVYVFAPSYENQTEEEFVVRYPSFPFQVAGAPVPNVLTGIFLRKVKELGIEIIHVHHPAIVGNVALALRKKLGIPVVFTYHTRYEEYLHYIKPLQKFEEHTGIIDRYLKYFCNQCDMLIAPTPGMRRYLIQEKELDVPIGVLPTGILEESFCPNEKQTRMIRERYAAGADYLFCTVARLAEEKNLLFELEGLAELKAMLGRRGKSFRHLMIGDGPLRGELERSAKRLGLETEVIFTGNIANEEIKNYQAASDLFLFASKSETQGIVLLEAMAAGTPVVAVDASGVCDIVWHGKNGFLVQEDKKAWAAAAAEALRDAAGYKRMCQKAKETAGQYSESAVADCAELYYFNTLRLCREKYRHSSISTA